MQIQYLVVSGRDMTDELIQKIITEGWKVNDPNLITLSRPVPASPPAEIVAQSEDVIDADPNGAIPNA